MGRKKTENLKYKKKLATGLPDKGKLLFAVFCLEQFERNHPLGINFAISAKRKAVMRSLAVLMFTQFWNFDSENISFDVANTHLHLNIPRFKCSPQDSAELSKFSSPFTFPFIDFLGKSEKENVKNNKVFITTEHFRLFACVVYLI